jgi:4-aminobutyrate aminotransferase-like enzyme
MGALLKKGLEKHRNSRFVKDIRGKGLFLAIEFGN